MLDFIVGKFLNHAEDAAQGNGENLAPETSGQKTLRVFLNILYAIVTFAFLALGLYAMLGGAVLSVFEADLSKSICMVGIIVPLIFGIATLFVPFLRRPGSFTRSCAVTLIIESLWWAYVYFTNPFDSF